MSSQDKVHVQAELDALLEGVWYDRLQPKALILNYLVMKKFNIIRLPTYFDRTFTVDESTEDLLKIIDGYDDSLLGKLESQLDVVYQETQSILKRKYPSRSVKLYRAICPLGTSDTGAHTFPNRKVDDVTLLPAYLSLLDDEELVPLEIDTLSGWSEGNENQRYGSVILCKDWNIEDILLVSDYLVKEEWKKGSLESNEWLCINKDKRGIVNFNMRDIELANFRIYLNSNPDTAEHENYQKDLQQKLEWYRLGRNENQLKNKLKEEYNSLIRKRKPYFDLIPQDPQQKIESYKLGRNENQLNNELKENNSLIREKKLYFNPILSSNLSNRFEKKELVLFRLKKAFKSLFKK